MGLGLGLVEFGKPNIWDWVITNIMLRYMLLQLYEEYGTIILVIIEAPIV